MGSKLLFKELEHMPMAVKTISPDTVPVACLESFWKIWQVPLRKALWPPDLWVITGTDWTACFNQEEPLVPKL